MDIFEYAESVESVEPDTLGDREAHSGLPESPAAAMDTALIHSLQAEFDTALYGDAELNPAALLTRLAVKLYGAYSPESDRLAELLKRDAATNYAMARANLAQRRKLLKQEKRQLERQAQRLADELKAVDEQEQALIQSHAGDAGTNAGIQEVLQTVSEIDFANPDTETMRMLTRLYDRHSTNPAAMGLLLGATAGLAWDDMTTQVEWTAMRARMAATATDGRG